MKSKLLTPAERRAQRTLDIVLFLVIVAFIAAVMATIIYSAKKEPQTGGKFPVSELSCSTIFSRLIQ